VKISGVDAFPVQARAEIPFAASVAVGTHTFRSSLLVRVQTDDGLEGWGETHGPLEVLAVGVEKALAPALLGKDPLPTRRRWQDMQQAARLLRAGLIRGISAVDMALWDIKGQILGQPIAVLLGAAPGGRFPAEGNSIFYPSQGDPIGARVEWAQRFAAAGFRGIKVKIGGLSPDEDLRHVAAIREALDPSVMLAVDANCGYETRTAIYMAQRLAALGVYWFEEPLPLEDVAGFDAVARASHLWIAGGQALPSAEAFLPLLEARALHLVQPSLGAVGGFTALQDVAALARAFGARYSASCWGSGVVHVASLHMRAATATAPASPFPDLDWVEYEITDNPLVEAVLDPPIVPKDGYLEVPTGPGLGVRVNLDAVREFSIPAA
jgi:D-galactarolactone cycloisomerase